VALAVSSAVCGMVASRKKSDGGVGAMLTASIEYQRVMAQQLQDLQLGMAQVLAKLNELPTAIRAALYEERLNALQAEIGASIIQYNNEVTAAAVSYASYQEWSQNALARQRMLAIWMRLDVAVTKIDQGRWGDAVTSLYLPPALFASMGAIALLGESHRLKAEAQRYLDLMQRALDPKEKNSIGSDLSAREARFKSIAQSLKVLGVQLPPAEQTAPMRIVLGEVAVQHYVPAQPAIKKNCYYEKEVGRRCDVDIPAKAAIFGQTDGFSFVLTIEPTTVTDGKPSGSNFGVRQFIPTKFEVTKGASANAPLVRAPAPGDSDRLKVAGSSDAWRDADSKGNQDQGLHHGAQ
jgi:hypothetical protein